MKEVMLRDIQLPPEYAKGLEDLLLKEQEDDQLTVQTDIQQKQVKISQLQAEAQKAQQVTQAEGERAVEGAGSEGRSRCHAVHAASEGEADSAVEAGGGGAQGSDDQECRGRG